MKISTFPLNTLFSPYLNQLLEWMHSSILTQKNWPVSKEELFTVDYSACLIESELEVHLESSRCVSSFQEFTEASLHEYQPTPNPAASITS